MRLTKYGHACVRLEADGGSIVFDPGTYSPDVDLDGVADVLVEGGTDYRRLAPGAATDL